MIILASSFPFLEAQPAEFKLAFARHVITPSALFNLTVTGRAFFGCLVDESICFTSQASFLRMLWADIKHLEEHETGNFINLDD